jgi:phosphate-selective porin OprO/OprP
MGSLRYRLMVGVGVLSALGLRAEDPPGGSPRSIEGIDERLTNVEGQLQGMKGLRLEDPSAIRVYFREGLRLETADRAYTARIGGRLHADLGFHAQDSGLEAFLRANPQAGATRDGSIQDGAEIRRSRLNHEATIYDLFFYRVEFDFAGGDGLAHFRNVYVGGKIPEAGSLFIGNFKEPVGLEELTSSNDIPFMERSLTSTFTPAYNLGIMLQNSVLDQRMTYAAGVFREDTGDLAFSQRDGKYNVSTRLTGLPFYEDDGRCLLHLGGSLSYRNPATSSGTVPADMSVVRFRQRPEAHLAPRLVDTDNIAVEDYQQGGLEAAAVFGPLWLQGEGIVANVEQWGGPDLVFHSYYGMIGYILTGEHRPYNRASGVFSRVKPKQNFLDGQGGLGAWEIAARYSYINLDDANIAGGRLHDVTLGLNWYLNPILRVMMNGVWAHREGVGDFYAFLMRFQAAF